MNAERLLALAHHLEYGKLGHKKFDFGVFNEGGKYKKNKDIYTCGTSGCALGEMPILVPSNWKFRRYDGFPELKTNELGPKISAMVWFGIDYGDVEKLFYLGHTLPWLDNSMLLSDADQTSVANNIRAFVEYKSKQT